MRSDLPTGTVTFLFTDVEGSTRLLHELGAEAYAEALAVHRRLIREACASQGGVEVDTQGDAFFFAFPTAPGAVAAASALTEALAAGPVQVRVGLHTGTPNLTDEGYTGDAVVLGARLASSAHGGQVALSASTRELLDHTELIRLGEHRYKDLDGPVVVFQLGRGLFPPLKSISNTNLPRPSSSFVGREHELREVRGRLESGARLLTLTGPGGSGKTRLAIETASTLLSEYRSGVFWVGLASVRDPSLVMEQVAQALGARDSVAEHIGARELLLLVDNVEQVIESAPELAALVRACPNLALLVTSRELLRVQGEVEYSVPPLKEIEAVELFCLRSVLEPSHEISALCERLDSMPLSVELAAARTKALSPAQILERLSSRLDLLKGGRDADPRQQTLRATIEWSYDLLSDSEKQVFARLSVFPGGWTLEAAEKVSLADVDALQSLVEKSLVRFRDERYLMFETIREFASERLAASGDRDLLRARHAEYFTAMAEMTHRDWMYGTAVRSPYGWFRAEQASLRDAAECGDTALRLRLLHAARHHGTFTGHERRRMLEAALATLGDDPSVVRARALAGVAEAAQDMNDYEGALAYHDQAADLYRSLVDGEGLARALVGRGWDLWELGLPGEARASFETALETARGVGATPVIQGAANSLASISLYEGDFDAALRLAAEAEETDRSGSYSQRVSALVALRRGDAAEAVRVLTEAVSSQYDLGYEPLLPFTLDALAAALVAEGDAERAAVLTGHSEVLRDTIGFEPDSYARGLQDEVARAARRELGEEGYRAAAARGASLTTHEAVELARTDA